MLDFLWVDSFFGNFTIETFSFLENNVTFSAKHYTFWKLCSHWLEFSKNSPSITCFLFSKNNITSVSTTFDSSLTTLGNGIYSAEQQPSLLSFFHIIHCSDQHQRPVEWSLRVRCNPTYHSVAHYWAPATTVWHISSGTGSSHGKSAWNSRNGSRSCCDQWASLPSR